MHKCVGVDRRFDPERTASVIAEIDADIIAIQEADKRFGERSGLLNLDVLERDCGLVPVPITALSSTGHGWHGNMIMIRKGAVGGVRQLRLPGVEPRGALVVTLDRALGHPHDLVTSVEVHDTPLARIASDHLPIKAHIDLKVVWERSTGRASQAM